MNSLFRTSLPVMGNTGQGKFACPVDGNQEMERAGGDSDTGGNKEIGVVV